MSVEVFVKIVGDEWQYFFRPKNDKTILALTKEQYEFLVKNGYKIILRRIMS